ncbi:hypothetical protein [Streptomyces sp. 7N604]|uniref:hypothetical protein n=1 Tax=Streptomyces sp. 7N604 TaxID=3457415 RepID=UPI003FD01A81
MHIPHARRVAATVTLAVALTITSASCGSSDEAEQTSGSSPSSFKEDGTQKRTEKQTQRQSPAPQEPESVIATLKGDEDITLALTSAVRDAGGFVTIKGIVKNSGNKSFYGTSFWAGPDLAILKGSGGSSFGGATLVDQREKKRYYILRDTENRPLSTTGIPVIEANSETPVYMQFPAPPESTAEVDLQVPTFESTTLELQEGE